MLRRSRVVVYVEREDGLLVFDHRDIPEAGTQVPAGGVEQDEALIEAAIREVREETGIQLVRSRRSSGRTNISTAEASLR